MKVTAEDLLRKLVSTASHVVPEYDKPKWYELRKKANIRWMTKNKLPFKIK